MAACRLLSRAALRPLRAGAPTSCSSRHLAKDVHEAATAGYDGLAAEGAGSKGSLYDQRRPGYDGAVVEELTRQLQLAQGRVQKGSGTTEPAVLLELGAGTGKFSQSLAERLAEEDRTPWLLASEPVEGMREVLKGKLAPFPRAIVSPGAADDLREAQNCAAEAMGAAAPPPVCGIAAAQAFHWFATDQTVAELARVLAPGGILSLIWNNRDTNLEWVHGLEEIVKPLYPPDVPRQQYGDFMRPFTGDAPGARLFAPMGVFCSSTQQRGSVEMVVGRVLSLSVVANRPKEEQESIAERCRQVVREHLGDAEDITLPYLSHAFFFAKRAAPVSTQEAREAYAEDAQQKLLGEGVFATHSGWRPIPYASTAQSPEGLIWHALGLRG